MKKNAIKTAGQQTFETDRKIRKDWGPISPVTRVICDKRRKAPKHKGRQFDD